MKYYVTIYIDKLLEAEMVSSLFQGKGLDFTHAFLGFTRKHPDELDKIDKELMDKDNH